MMDQGNLPDIPKKRGRPATGKAMTAAQRQAACRDRKRKQGEGEHLLNTWLSSEAWFALNRLAKRDGVTKKEILEKLVVKANDAILKTLELDTPEWDEYFS